MFKTKEDNRPSNNKRTFTYSDGKLDKSQNLEVFGYCFAVSYRKRGTSEQTQTKSLAGETACIKKPERLIRKKTKNGHAKAEAPSSSSKTLSSTRRERICQHLQYLYRLRHFTVKKQAA